MKKTINLNGRKVVYELKRTKVKNINLRIRFDCSVYVSANNLVADSAIENFLRKKAVFILSALDKYAEIVKHTNNNYSYVTGESFRYLGKELRLAVTNGKNCVSSNGVYLTLSVKDTKDTALKKRLIAKWYNEQCKIIFAEIINEIFPIFEKYNIAKPSLILRNMTSRWGSCRPKRGIITLNKNLIEAPRNTIEYVAMHEFVHFLHLNHSKNFYEMLSALMPDWKSRKKILESTMFQRNT